MKPFRLFKTRTSQKLFLLLVAVGLLSSAFLAYLPGTAAAAVSCSSTTCLSVDLSGQTNGITRVTAHRPYNSIYQNDYNLQPDGGNRWTVNHIEPFDKVGLDPGTQSQFFQFQVTVYRGSTAVVTNRPVTLKARSRTVLPITVGATPEQTGTLQGTITFVDGNGKPLSLTDPSYMGKLTLTCTAGACMPTSVTSPNIGKDGKYSFSNLRFGTYELKGTFDNSTGTDATPVDEKNIVINHTGVTNHDFNAKPSREAPTNTDPCQANPNDPSCHDDNATCETGGFGLNWILCPVFNGVADASDWMFKELVQPLLRTAPISTDANDPSFQIWSQFRVFGDIFLIIALLVIVFGQAIGGGLVDAYTAKKALPRILIAAILINLSIYIVAALVDITNILGGGLGALMTAPLKNAGAFHISPSGIQAGSIIAGSGLALGATLLAFGAKVFTGSEAGMFILLFVIMPVLFGLIAAFITMIIRKGIILALVLVSPVAFALYALPNTEKYFRKWWELLFQTLMVYPIVIIIFAVADILSVTMMQANNAANPLAAIIAFVLQFLPLLMIPYAFRLAGGAIGRMHEVFTNYHKKGQEAIKGNPNDPTSLRNVTRRKMQNRLLDAREIRGSTLSANTRNGAWGRASRRLGGIVGGPRLAERQAIKNNERQQAIENTWSNGNDGYAKASTIALSTLDARRGTDRHRGAEVDAAGNVTRREQWMAADGTWFTEDEIRQGNAMYGAGADHQTNFKMLLGKTEPLGTEAQDRVFSDYLDWANEAGLDAGTATGRWQGISIPMKGMRLDMRRAQIGRNATTGRLERTGTNHQALLTEYAGMAMHDQVKETPGTFQALRDSIQEAYSPTTGRTPEEQTALQDAAARAYANLDRYVNGTGAPAALMGPAAAPPGGGAAGPSSYSSSSSAAAKNGVAARQALDDLNASGLGALLASRMPRDIT